MTGEVEAHIIALACAEPPKGYAKWTLRLLADRSVKLGYIDSISHTQVGRILKNEHKASPKEALVHTTFTELIVRCRDGGCLGGLVQLLAEASLSYIELLSVTKY